MGEDPEVIEQEIERTRERMSERTDALAYKADVKSRAQDAIAEKRDAIRGRVRGALGGAREAAPDPDQVRGRADQVRGRARQGVSLVRDNPLGLALGAAAVGALIGLALPRTAIEDERMGETADALKAKIAETGQDALGRGQQVAQDAMQAAKESGSQHAGELAEGVQERAQDVGQSATST